ncbi:MAG: serine/threonine-protein phosphatase, partial [Gemmatimonadetes bacterium]|nr:serine/threonine-protein phosphatase [Gemmatimonadota bacterium]
VGVMIGDVSGHGFPAALIMALVMSAAAIYAEQGAAPATVLEYVDRAIGDELESTEMYLSLCYCVLSPGTPEIAYSNAGHPHAFVVESDGTARRLFATDPPMGIGKPPYGQSAADWSPGEDILLLFTDGLSDTLAHAGRSSGEDLVLSTVAARHGRRADEILHALFELCRRATPSIPSDDRTAVILRTR